MTAFDARKWGGWFDTMMRQKRMEARKQHERSSAVKQAQAETKSIEKAHFVIDVEAGRRVFLKGGQDPLLRHEADLLADLERNVQGTSDADYFNFPIWKGKTRDGHFLMAFTAIEKTLTLEHFKDPSVVKTVLKILAVLRERGFAQGDLKPESFVYYYRKGCTDRSIVMIDFDRGRNKFRVPPVEGPSDHYKGEGGVSEMHWGQFLATPRYGTVLQHLGFISTPCTDLEQLGMLVIMACFPDAALWSGLKKSTANAHDRNALIAKVKFLIMAQCAGLLTFRFRNRPTEDPLLVLHEQMKKVKAQQNNDWMSTGDLSGFGEEETFGTKHEEGGSGNRDASAAVEQEEGGAGPSLGEASRETFTLPEKCSSLLRSTLSFAMDQFTDEEHAAYSGYARELHNFADTYLEPLPTSPEPTKQDTTGTGKSGSPVIAGAKTGSESERARNRLSDAQRPSPQKPRGPVSGSERGLETTPGKLVERRLVKLLREGGMVEDPRDPKGEHKVPVAPALRRVFTEALKGGRPSAEGKENTTEIDWLGRWGTAEITPEGHLASKKDGRIALKQLVLSPDNSELSEWATTVSLRPNSKTRVLMEEGVGSTKTALRKVSQADFNAAVLLYNEAKTLNPLALLKRDIVAISLVKSARAGVVEDAIRELGKSGSTRHPYLTVLAWLGRGFVGIPFDLHVDQASLTHSMEVSASSHQMSELIDVQRRCASLENQVTLMMAVVAGLVVVLVFKRS